MQPPERAEFLRILNGLAALKPGKPLTPEGLEVFWQALAGWSIGEFRAAAAHLARAVEFMPNPYHFEQLRLATRPTAGEAWTRAVEHAATSAYRHGLLGNHVVDACVRAIGGYAAIAMCEADKLHFLERRFCEHFEAKQDAEDVRDALPQLAVRPALKGPQSAQALLGSARSW